MLIINYYLTLFPREYHNMKKCCVFFFELRESYKCLNPACASQIKYLILQLHE